MGSSDSTVDQHSYNQNDQIQILANKQWHAATVYEVNQKYIKVKYNNTGAIRWLWQDEYDKQIKKEPDDIPMMPKDINEWKTNDIKNWISSSEFQFDDENNELKKLTDDIESNEITGGDLVDLDSVDDFVDQFEISKKLAKYIYDCMQTKNSKSTSSDTQDDSEYTKIGLPGIVGLENLVNTCFANSVIQIIMQTPKLVQYLQKANINTKPITIKTGYNIFTSWSQTVEASMLNAFIQLAHDYSTNGTNTIKPESVLYHLRLNNGKPDPKFRPNQQCDALAALTKMLTLMDSEIIDRNKQQQKKKDYYKKPYFSCNKILELKEEEKKVNQNLLLYNQYKSVIRDIMCFVERNIFTCMKCMKTKVYYEIKDKVLLPARDNTIVIDMRICIPSKESKRLFKEFKLLDYVKINTLQYQIYRFLLDERKYPKHELTSSDQIKIGVFNLNTKKHPSKWVSYFNTNEKCEIIHQNLKNGLVFALVKIKKEETKSDSKCFLMNQVNIFVNGKNEIMKNKNSILSFMEMTSGTNVKGEKILKHLHFVEKYNMYCYLNDRIIVKNGKYTIDADNATLITLYIDKQAPDNNKIQKYNFNQMDENYKFYAIRHGCNYSKILFELNEFEKCNKKKGGYFKNEDHSVKDGMKKLRCAKKIYQIMENNTSYVMKTLQNVFDVFSIKPKNRNSFAKSVTDAFELYIGTKILEVNKARCECKNAATQQETKIVKYPQILLFSVERSDNGRRINKKFSYNEHLSYTDAHNSKENKFELYGVCNHSSDNLKFGHYTSYVKCLHNNEWYKADDEDVYEAHRTDVVRASNDVIILAYKKIK